MSETTQMDVEAQVTATVDVPRDELENAEKYAEALLESGAVKIETATVTDTE